MFVIELHMMHVRLESCMKHLMHHFQILVEFTVHVSFPVIVKQLMRMRVSFLN